MDKRFDIVLAFDVTEDGKRYHRTTLEYHGVPADALLAMEKALMGALLSLGDQGLALKQAKAGD